MWLHALYYVHLYNLSMLSCTTCELPIFAMKYSINAWKSKCITYTLQSKADIEASTTPFLQIYPHHNPHWFDRSVIVADGAQRRGGDISRTTDDS
jgi:hypothetical protein